MGIDSFCGPHTVMPVVRVTALRETQRYSFQPGVYSCPSPDRAYQSGPLLLAFIRSPGKQS